MATGKRASRPDDSPSVGLNLRVTAATARRLKLHAANDDVTISSIVDRLVMGYLRDLAIREVVAPVAKDAIKGPNLILSRCVAWLEDLLGAGIQAVHEIITQAEDEGYSKGTVYRAKEKIDIEEFRIGSTLHWKLNFPGEDESAA